MGKRDIFIIAGVVAVVLIIFFSVKSNDVAAPTNEENKQTENVSASTPGTKAAVTAKTAQSGTGSTKTIVAPTPSNLPEIDFLLDKRTLFPLRDYPEVEITIEKVVFGRGDAVTSTGCQGIPNANFSTYLYPGSGVCISTERVDGSPRGIVALHVLLENNGNLGFGGNSDVLKLHYLRSDSTGKPSYRFAYPLMGLASYYINGYSSKEIILSYLVPEDQLVFNLVSGYKEPAPENKTLNVYDFSTNGLQIDFGSKTLKIVK